MNLISAEIICDSLAPNGSRLTTFVLNFPRIILAEFNTHRVISRNSASSRAIPFEKMRDAALNDPFIPIKWMKNHKGMQGEEYHDETTSQLMKKDWLYARDMAIATATDMYNRGLTKQLCNRILEPFLYHKVICSSTEWENFFALRAHSQAEIHIQDLAYKMLEVYNTSIPKELKVNEWHIPFGDQIDESRLVGFTMDSSKEELDELKVKIATARCARISYNNFEGSDDYKKDFILHDSLSKSGHWSPFEHCAQAGSSFTGQRGNFYGFKQYRGQFEGENRKDNRVNLHVRNIQESSNDSARL